MCTNVMQSYEKYHLKHNRKVPLCYYVKFTVSASLEDFVPKNLDFRACDEMFYEACNLALYLTKFKYFCTVK